MSRIFRFIAAALAIAITAVPLPGGTADGSSNPPNDLVDRAKKDGAVNFYTSADIAVAERIGKAFEAKYPGIHVQVERSGSERVFQRVGQEYQSNIHNVDVVNTSDAAHFLVWKGQGMLANFLPPDVARYYPPQSRDPQNTYAVVRATLSPIAYNTRLVKPADAPKSYADLLQPKWASKIVKAHPGYSGNVMTATYEITHQLGWKYLEALAKQHVMQVQSATEPPKILARGEQMVMADGNEYNCFDIMQTGGPVAIVYPTEGTPFVSSPAAMMKAAPHPNAARLLMYYLFSAEGQQLLVDVGGLRSVRFGIKEPSSRVPIGRIRLMKEDAHAVETQADAIKAHYSQLFGT